MTTRDNTPADRSGEPALQTAIEHACLRPAPTRKAAADLPSLPALLSGPPFGTDAHGALIRQVRGSSVIAAIRQMQDYVASRVDKDLPRELPPPERQAKLHDAREQALRSLIKRLNRAIPDGRIRLDADILLRDTNFYSHEFNLFLNEYARSLSGDPDFYFHRGLRSIPRSMLQLFRPLSLGRGFRLVAHFTAKASVADIRAVETSATSAVLQWHPQQQLAVLPKELHQHYIRMACPAYQGTYASVPPMHSGLPLASVRERQCLLDGDPCCEWEFRWEPQERSERLWLWVGAGLSAVLGVGVALQVPGWHGLATGGVLVPALLGWAHTRAAALRCSRDKVEHLLLQQRDSADEQFDGLQKANAQLQLANSSLQRTIEELTTLHEIGLALSTTLDLDELIERSLRAVTTHLHLDGAAILLVDPASRKLVGAGSVGCTEAAAQELRDVRLSLHDVDSVFVRVIERGEPLLTASRGGSLARLCRADAALVGDWPFLAVPLTTKGNSVGLLVVDNHLTERPISHHLKDLLTTAGTEIAAAVENARLVKALGDKAESAIRESEQRLANIFSFLPDPTFAVDDLGRVTAWNRAMEAQTGIPAASILGKENREYSFALYGERRPMLIDMALMPTDEVSRLYPGVRRLGTTLSSEVRVRSAAGGDERVISATAAPLFDSRGERIGAIESIRDVSDVRRTEHALRQTERLLADVFNFLPDATFAIDRQGKVTAWNRAMETLTGLAASAILGKGGYAYAVPFYGEARPLLIDLVLQPDATVESRYANFARGDAVLRGEAFMRHLPNGARYLFGMASVLRDDRGELVGAIETIRDLTDRRKGEEELERARDAAEAASRAKSTFLANMSHELRTPLNAIIGYSEMLQELAQDRGDDDYLADLARIHGAGKHLLGLISDILDLSKIEAGKMDLHLEDFDLDPVVRDAVSTIGPLVEKNANTLRVDLGQDLGSVHADATKLRQILLNLLSNACKFTRDGLVTLQVSRHPRVGAAIGPDEITVVVRDTGVGITEEQMPLLFRPFSQGDGSVTRKYGGTGLGLAISRRFCQMMQGDIAVQSDPGKSTVFTVHLPARVQPLQPSEAGLAFSVSPRAT